MSKKQINKTSKIVSYILLLLVIFAAIGFVLRFTNCGTTDFKTFYVQIDEKTYTNDFEMDLCYGNPVHIETKYTFASNSASSHKGYKVKIVPYVTENTNFYFSVDGQAHSFGAEKDLTAAFDIEYGETGFTVSSPLNLESALQMIYGEQTAIISYGVNEAETVYLNMVVSAYDESQSIIIGLRLIPFSLTFDKDGIII